jgi:long-subunit fatty acid transport protein
LKSTTEFNAGLKTFYQIDDRWSVGAGFTFKHHEDNGVEGLATDLGKDNVGMQSALVDGLLKLTEDMNDGFDEYIISLSGSYQLTDATQVSLYGEYTFDDAHNGSQNGTDVKAEVGVRVNVQF